MEASKTVRTYAPLALLYAAVIAVAIAGTHEVVVRSDRAREQRSAAWDAWEAEMRRANCKVTGFTSERSATYPIWTCPDGTAHLGRAQ